MRTGNDCRCGIRKSALAVGMVSLAAMLGACTTSTPTPDQMSRTTTDTAPADLQLLCASAATGGGSALPVTSRRIDATTYQVDLKVGSSTKSCIIDNEGNVRSVQPAAT